MGYAYDITINSPANLLYLRNRKYRKKTKTFLICITTDRTLLSPFSPDTLRKINVTESLKTDLYYQRS